MFFLYIDEDEGDDKVLIPSWVHKATAFMATSHFILISIIFVSLIYAFGFSSSLIIRISAVILAGICMVLFFVISKFIDRFNSKSYWKDMLLANQQCPYCHYDARHLPENRCPECGEKWESK